MVRETAEEIVARVVDFRRSIAAVRVPRNTRHRARAKP